MTDFLSLFHAQVAETPSAIALSFEGSDLTYVELSDAACRLAHRLRGLGVQPDDVVAIAGRRSLEVLIALLATLEVGAGYLPLDLSYPKDRLEFMVRDSKASFLLRQSGVELDLGAARPKEVELHLEGLLRSEGPTSVLGLPWSPEHLAYAIYTSGSTGIPKGVAMVRGALAPLIEWQRGDSAMGSGSATLQFAPLSFDVHFQEIFSTWTTGGRLVLVREEMRLEARALLELIERERIERLFLPFIALQSLSDVAIELGHVPTSLKEVITAGEQLQVTRAVVQFFERSEAKLFNHYGPSETHVVTSFLLTGAPSDWAPLPPIGTALPHVETLILTDSGEPAALGEEGELYLAGVALARGYLHRPELTDERFPTIGGKRHYKTGDLVVDTGNGVLQFLGRKDGQVKVRGYRIELGEIEVRLVEEVGVREAAVIVDEPRPTEKRIVAYLTTDPSFDVLRLRSRLESVLPEYMVPSIFVTLPQLPRTPSGKVDKRSLPKPGRERPELGVPYAAPRDRSEEALAHIWCDLLSLDRIGTKDNFFALGGNSLLALKAVVKTEKELGAALPITRFFEYPTIEQQARFLAGGPSSGPARRTRNQGASAHGTPVAVIGMAGRFPGASSVEQLWALLIEGREGLRTFSKEEKAHLLGVDTRAENYVPVRGVLDGPDRFDARFFGISPNEARVMDPQQRLLLEISWHALEHAGYAPGSSESVIGVYAGTHNNSYYQELVSKNPDAVSRIGAFAVMTANEKDYVATRIAHRLNLTGPALSIHTACSTSLVAIATGVQHLRAGMCDIALAGGASLTIPVLSGHFYEEGGMLSKDGHTRSFDAEANGTVFSDGAAMVVLKLLDDAIRDGDTIYSVIHGVGINNDGGEKSSFTAPSIEGQAAVIAMAQADAGLSARDIDYVEAHGTATPLGDPIEVEALTQAFREVAKDSQSCLLGSIKSNLGHLTAAAGVAGLIKTTLALHREKLPASLHFKTPNPKIHFEQTPFRVVTEPRIWPRGQRPRYAGISSFGVGGTNAHLVVGEAPLLIASGPSLGPQLLLLSAKTKVSLSAATLALSDGLKNSDAQLSDIAFTLATGRGIFEHRRAIVASSLRDAASQLAAEAGYSSVVSGATRRVAFLFPGQGAQYVGMGKSLYDGDLFFRLIVDECAEHLAPILKTDLREVLFGLKNATKAAEALKRTEFTQTALFTLEYALARRLEAWGVRADTMIGHSVGEFVAACLANVFDLPTALSLVARRGQLMQSMPPGSMLSIRLDSSAILAELPDELDLAADNAPGLCVVAGPDEAIDEYLSVLESRGVAARKLETSHAFHSRSMDGAEALFRRELEGVTLKAPTCRIISTCTGLPLTAEEATSPAYWASHLRRPVQFRSALAQLAADPSLILLEVGPRRGLSTMAAKRGPGEAPSRQLALPTLGDRCEDDIEWSTLLSALGRLWVEGLEVDMSAYFRDERRRKVPLPGYRFAADSFWLDAPAPKKTSDSTNPVTEIQLMNRQARLIGELKTHFEQASGLDFQGAHENDDFMSLGVDSLLVTQLALKIKQSYKVPVTFRHLMENYSTFGTLAAHLDQSMPVEAPASAAVHESPAPAVAQNEAAAPSWPAALPALPLVPGDNSVARQMLQLQMAQLSLLQQQISLALGATTAAPALPVAPSPSPLPSLANAAATPAAASSGDGEVIGPVKYDVQKAFGAIARIHKQSDELTPAQEARLTGFIKRYNDKTRSSKAHTAEYRAVHADPRVVTGFKPRTKEVTYPIVTVRSQGARLWDLDGNEYIDALNGFGSSFFGTQHPRINAALHKKIDEGTEIGPQTELAGKAARLVCELTDLDRAAFCNTGSEAVMGALRIARTVTGRPLVVAFSGSYHGIFDEVIVRDTKSMRSIPAAPGIMPGAVANIVVLEYGSAKALEVIRERADEIAAVLVEPVQSRRPDFRPKEFLKEVRALTSAQGIALIFDEVITGFRSHPKGAQAFYEIDADICTYGKVVGGGMPIGVIAGRNPWMDALDGGTWQFGDDSIPTAGVTYFAGTFVRHPLTMAAVYESLLMMKEAGPKLQAGVTALTTSLATQLNTLFKEAGVPIEIRHFASLWKTFFTEQLPYGELLFCHLRERGVHIWDGFPCFLTTAHTESDVTFMVNAYRSAVEELQAGDFLPSKAQPTGFDASKPPVEGARLGRDQQGNPAWFVQDPAKTGKYIQLS